MWHDRLHPCLGRLGEVARQPEIGEAVFPGDRRETGDATDRPVVAHGISPPLSRGRVDNPALVQGAPAVIPHVVFIANVNDFVGASNFIRLSTEHRRDRTWLRPSDQVFPVDLAHVRALSRASRNGSTGFRNDVRHIGVEFGKGYPARTPHHVRFAIIVKKDGDIMQFALHRMMFPGTLRIRRGKDLRPESVDIGQNVEGLVVVGEGGCPNALPIDRLAVFETKTGSKIQAVKDVTHQSPIDEVLGMQDRQPRHHMRRSARHVVVFPHTDHDRIGHVFLEKRVREGAVAVVRRPAGLFGLRNGGGATRCVPG